MNAGSRKAGLGNAFIFLLAAVFVLAIVFMLPVHAAAASVDQGGGLESGPGDGSGQGKNAGVALTLVSSSVDDGATNVPLDPVIELEFNKNVVNLAVLEDNSTCFHLIDENGAPVSINVVFPDDQIQRDFRRNIFIVPAANLQAGSQYELVVDGILCAKNGTLIDNAHSITFETGGEATGGQNKALQKLGDNCIVYNNALEKTKDSVAHERVNQRPHDISSPPAKQPMDLDKLSSILLIVIVALFICAGVFFWLQGKRGKK